MLKKKLFKSLKSFTAAAIAALTVTAGIAATGAGFNPAGLLAPTTAYAFEHQSYADSTGYSLRLDGDTWHCVNADGQIDYSYDGLAENEFGWWKVSNGEVDFGFNGLALNQYGWWKVTGGAVDFSYTGMAENEYGWWYVTNGAVDFGYTGLSFNQYGWWYLENGTVNFDYTGLKPNEFGWWKITDGYVDFGYTGLAYDEAVGWWKVTNGAVDFRFKGIAENQYGSWMITNGTVDFGYTGRCQYGGKIYDVTGGYAVYVKDNDTGSKENSNAENNVTGNNNKADNSNKENTTKENKTGKLELVDNQWVYMVDGKIDTSYNYMAENEYGWWKVTNGVVDKDFSGIAEKADGTKWLFSGGSWEGYQTYSSRLNTQYIGTIVVDGVAYDTNKGFVTPAKEDISKTYYLEPDEYMGDGDLKNVCMNTWSYGKYVKNKDGIVYMMTEREDDRGRFEYIGTYDKETNSFVNVFRWSAKQFFD